MGSHLKTSDLLKTSVKGKEVGKGNALKMSGKSGSLALFSEGVTSPLSERQSVLFSPRRNVVVSFCSVLSVSIVGEEHNIGSVR